MKKKKMTRCNGNIFVRIPAIVRPQTMVLSKLFCAMFYHCDSFFLQNSQPFKKMFST